MTIKKAFLLLLPPLLLCMAFDPADEKGLSGGAAAQLDHLLKIEDRLVASAACDIGGLSGDTARERIFGADPRRILYFPRTGQYLILLHNASSIVLCDGDLRVMDRCATPRLPVALERVGGDIVLVGGELSGTVGRYQIQSDRINPLPGIEFPDVVSVKDLVYDADAANLFLIDDFSRNLIQVKLPVSMVRQPAVKVGMHTYPIGPGPSRILGVKNHLIINFLLAHRIQIIPLHNGVPAFDKAASIVNDGPFWSVSALMTDGKLLIAAGGIENRPLSRQLREFGYVDSFLYLFTLVKDSRGRFGWRESDRGDARRYRAVNLSNHGVLTPKSLVFTATGGAAPILWVTGYGADRALACRVGVEGVAFDREIRVMPGISDAVITPDPKGVSLVYTTPLLDRVVKQELVDAGVELKLSTTRILDYSQPLSPANLGEILFFTGLMSPNNSSRGELSRFTCEACHFEGQIDGRVHFTGRDAIYASTKPVQGLVNNVPLFSRGGDTSLSSMVMAEFMVANQNRKGVFTIQKVQYPWMSLVPDWPQTATPMALRRGLLWFFTEFNPEPNPWRAGHPALTKSARRGLAVFRERCADCHQPLSSTRTGKGVDFSRWQHWLTEENRDLIWGAPFFSRTGVKPYVRPAGSRVPSLRRVWMKYPLFTNGSVRTIGGVLKGFRYKDATVWHQYDTGAAGSEKGLKALTSQEMADLEALLRYF